MKKINRLASSLAVAALASSAAIPAFAQAHVTSTHLDVSYNPAGLWNDPASARGLEIDGDPVSFPGTPWQQVSIGFDYQNAAYTYGANTYGSDWSVTLPVATMSADITGAAVMWSVGPLQILKQERWEIDGQVMRIDLLVTNQGCDPVSNFALIHGVDPDQDATTYQDFSTINNVVVSGNYVYSEGVESGLTVGYGRCDGSGDEVGHSFWSTDPYAALADEDGHIADDTMHIRHTEAEIGPRETKSFTFIFTEASFAADAVDLYYTSRDAICGNACIDHTLDASYFLDVDATRDAREQALAEAGPRRHARKARGSEQNLHPERYRPGAQR